MDDFLIRLATREDIDDVISLMRACFGEREFLHRKWYEWFNFGCPAGFNRNYVAVDKATGRMAGGYGLLPVKIKINGQILDGSLCTNVMTHPDYQGKGLFTQMGRFCLATEEAYQSRISLGVPNENAYRGHMKLGWKVLSDLVFIAKFSLRNKPHRSRGVPAFDRRVGKLLAQHAQKANLAVAKDYQFLNWRYPKRPDKKYRLFVFEDGGSVEGYVALKYFDDNGYKKMHIVDIVASSEAAFDDLLLAAESCASSCDEINCWQVSHSICEKLFAHNGFVATARKDILIMHTNFGENMVPEPLNWWFALGDNDVY